MSKNTEPVSFQSYDYIELNMKWVANSRYQVNYLRKWENQLRSNPHSSRTTTATTKKSMYTNK